MTDPTTDGDTDARATMRGMPRWVKVSLILVGALVALLIVLKLVGRGPEHGPGMHRGSPQSVTRDVPALEMTGRG
jgi:hypothetical protein